MLHQVDYYFSLLSPWGYIGHKPFVDLVSTYSIKVNHKPVVLVELFSETSGLPLMKRHPVRQRYRMVELLGDALKSGRAAYSSKGLASGGGSKPMSTAMLSSNFPGFIRAVVLAACLASAGSAVAQAAPDTENGRYALSPIADGVLRLDTRTGAVSTCSNSGAGWACYAVPDERSALDAEIGRLQSENEKLKADLASREPTVTGKIEEPLPKSDSLKPSEPKVAQGERKIEIPLPSDRDMDRMMSFLERAWRRLIEMANRVQRDVNGRI